MPLLNDFRVHVRGNTVHPPSVDCFPSASGRCHGTVKLLLGSWGSVFRFDALAGSPEDSRSSNRKSGFSFANVYIHSLSAWSPNLANSAPCEGGTGGSAGSCNQQTHLFVVRQLLPAQKSSQQQNSSGTEKKSKCALTDGRLFPAPSTARFPYPVPPPSHEVTAGSTPPPPPSPHQLIRMHEAHGLGNQQGPRPSRFLETRLASSKTTKRKPPRGVRPSSTGPGAWAECRPQPTT